MAGKSNIKIVGTEILLKTLGKLQGHIKEGKIPFMLANDLKVMIIRRLNQGLGTFTAFEPYSTVPYYRDKQLRPIGRGGRRKTASGKTMRTIFYEGGYAEFAKATKSIAKVNLTASGAMLRDMTAIIINSSTAKLAFNQQVHAMKAMQLTDIKGQFLGANPLQEQKLSQNVTQIINRLIKTLGLDK